MPIRYKLTNQDLITYGDFQWTVGQKVTTSGDDELCGPGWLHCYRSPLLSVLHNPIHATIENPKLWEAKVGGKSLCDGQMKEGWTEMTLERELEIPEITLIQRIAYGILCTKEVCENEEWDQWADKWLRGEDRSKESAEAAWSAVRAAAESAAWTAALSANSIAESKELDLISIAQKAMSYK